MSAAKQARPASPARARLKRLGAFLWGPGRSLTLIALLLLGMLGGWYLIWRTVGQRVLHSESYALTADNVELTPPPDWIRCDIRGEVFRNASLDGPLSIMDDDLVERIRGAFSLHPWIAKVRTVTKQHPARVLVEVAYRRPVCMVEFRDELYPVDIRGILLPRDDFSPVEASRYPRLVHVDTAPIGGGGESWRDQRVLGGAQIAAALLDAWADLKLSAIVPSNPLVTGFAEEFTYTLVTRGGTRIFWGRAPDTKTPGELPAKEKVERLQAYAADHGTLEGQGGPQELDIYRMPPPRGPARPSR